jgi:hypothetical protein
MSESASTRIRSGRPPSASWSAAMFVSHEVSPVTLGCQFTVSSVQRLDEADDEHHASEDIVAARL